MFEGLKVRAAEYRLRLRQIELEEAVLYASDRLKKTLEDPDENAWTLLGGTADKALSEEAALTMRSQAIKFYYENPHGRNIIRLFEKYVAGRGFTIDPVSTLPQVQQVWDDVWKLNKMELRKKEIVRRTMRDGECFLRFFTKGHLLVIRFMNPDLVQSPPGSDITHGIQTNPDDIEEVLAYCYKGEWIPADQVHHIKIMVDSDVKRGRSFLEPVMRSLAMYADWIKDRMRLNRVRSIVALIKKVVGSPTRAANIVSEQETVNRKAPDGTSYQKVPEGVSLITTNQGVEYDLKAPNLQAADVQHDGRTLLLSICAGTGLPEFMVTSDSSNSNYASTMIAEGPAVREFQDWQDFFGEHFKAIYEKAINTAMMFGEIPQWEIITRQERTEEKDEAGFPVMKDITERIETSVECNVIFPELVHRDLESETKALVQQSQARWISDHTASARLDLDYDEEQRLITEEDKMRYEMDGPMEEEPDVSSEEDDENIEQGSGTEGVEEDEDTES